MDIGLGTLLFVAFVAGKLTGYLKWSWLWITAPLWIPWILLALGVGLAAALQ